MKLMILGSFAESLINFRGPLITALIKLGHEVIVCAPNADIELEKKIKKLGAVYCHIPVNRSGLNPFIDFFTMWHLFLLFKKVKPEKILNYTAKPVIYGSIAGWLAGIKGIYSIITGLGYAFIGTDTKTKVLGFFVKVLYKLSLKVNTKVFFQNADDAGLFLSDLLVTKEKVAIINGSGVDLDHFKPAPIPKEVSFLLIARLLKDKGIREFVNAAAVLKEKYSNISFKLVGWLDENPSCITAEELKLWQEQGTIDYMGRLSDVRPAIKGSSVYVLPSYREGTPRTVLEAMAMGRPVITTNAPGCKETVINGENGFLIPVKNVAQLVTAMEKFVNSPEIIPVMGGKSLKLVVDKYDVKKVNQTIIEAMGI